jgi:hypothetical protein
MFNLLEKLQKISDKEYFGEVSFKDLKELMDDNVFVVNKDSVVAKYIMDNDKIVESVEENKRALKEITKAIRDNTYIKQIKVAFKDTNEFEILDGFYALISITQLADEMPDRALSVVAIKVCSNT